MRLRRLGIVSPTWTGKLRTRTFVAAQAVGAAFAARLHELGWMCNATPGKPIAFTRDGLTIEPFEVVGRIRRGELDASAWRAECESVGLADVRLV